MEYYLVGGAVRDLLMNQNPKDMDFVVINSSHDEMISLGYSQVGSDFPVYLHPQTRNEFALARTERKTGKGYLGFEVETKNVSLKDDLRRRDLTINAIAIQQEVVTNGQSKIDGIIDPFNGQADIENKILRHVDPDAFKEDPVRVLRIARFLARWPSFSVAKETVALCREIVASGELEHLTAERVSAEMIKAMGETLPSRFFVFLRMIGALEIIFPEVHALVGVEQPYTHHPEGDAFVHTMMVMDCATGDGQNPLDIFCALVHDLGKGLTPPDKWPHHYGHEEAGVPLVHAMCDRLKLPTEYRNHGVLVARYHMHIHKFRELKASTIVRMFDGLKVNANSRIIELLPYISYCDAMGRTSFFWGKHYPNAALANNVFLRLSAVKLSNFKTPEEIAAMSVDQIKAAMIREKTNLVKRAISEWDNPE